LFQRVGGRGLPLAFVGTDRFDGDTDFGNLKASVERQIRALR
jgi:hypothetical protein